MFYYRILPSAIGKLEMVGFVPSATQIAAHQVSQIHKHDLLPAVIHYKLYSKRSAVVGDITWYVHDLLQYSATHLLLQPPYLQIRPTGPSPLVIVNVLNKKYVLIVSKSLFFTTLNCFSAI